jgi:hypothetical protein
MQPAIALATQGNIAMPYVIRINRHYIGRPDVTTYVGREASSADPASPIKPFATQHDAQAALDTMYRAPYMLDQDESTRPTLMGLPLSMAPEQVRARAAQGGAA